MQLRGIYSALLTPFTDDGEVDVGGAGRLADHLVGRGVQGVVPLGTTGEFCELFAAERRDVLTEVVRAVSGRVPVLAGVSGLSTRQARRNAVEAQRAGADAVLVLPPLYWKLDADGLYHHFRSVAAATDLPVVLYDFPALTRSPLPPSLVRRLAADEPQVVGAKLTVRDINDVTGVLAAVRPVRPDFAVVPGFEDLLPASVWAGADGAISGMANFCPELLVALHQALVTGDPRATPLYAHLMDLFTVYGLASPPVLALKAVSAAFGAPVSAVARTPDGDPARIVEAASAWAARHVPFPADLPGGLATATVAG